MKSWRVHEYGAMDNLQLDDIPVPDPGPGEVRIKLAYAALNPADAYLIKGQYPGRGEPPLCPGRDGSGVVDATGGDGRFQPGDRVIVLRGPTGVSRDGTLAEFVTVPECNVAPLPPGWSFKEGAAGPLVLLTAWKALVLDGRLQAGETVLVTGASGGVGTAAVMLAHALGARTIALSRSVKKRERLQVLGADLVIDGGIEDLPKRIKAALEGGRVDLTVENLGGPYIEAAIEASGRGGRILVVGLLAGLRAEFAVGLLIHKQLRIQGVSVGSYAPEEAQSAWAHIVEALNRTGARPVIDQSFPLNDVPGAFDRLAAGPMGKVLIAIAPDKEDGAR